jgi:hypothetical protein
MERGFLVDWTPFEVDGRALEWCAMEGRHTTGRPRGWPAHKPWRGKSRPVMMISVRLAGTSSSGFGMLFPATVEPTIARAIEAARRGWEYLA